MTDEGDLRLVLTVSQLEEGTPVISERISLQGLPWRLMVVSQDVVRNSQGGKGRTVGVFVQCVPDTPGSQNWSVAAHIKLKVQNYLNPDKCFTKVFDHKYSNRSSDWGYSSFIKWKDLVDPSRGLVKEEKIILDAKVQLKTKSETETKVQVAAMDMAIGLGVGGVDSLLLCPGCGERFETVGEKQPMVLKCGHSFCTTCLQKAKGKTDDKISLKCSTCSQLHTSEDGNETLLWFPNHSMLQIIENMLMKSKIVCQIHHHDKNYYCFDDHTMVCIYCAYHGEHSSHVCKHMDEARKEVEASLRKVKLSMSSFVSELERKVQYVKDEKELLRSQEAGVRQMIDDSYEQLKAILLRQRDLVFQELEDQTSELGSGIDSSLQELEEQYFKVKSILSGYTSWNSLPPREALEKSAEVQSDLSNIPSLCRGVKLPPQGAALYPKITFESGRFEIPSLGQLGRVMVDGIAKVDGVAKVEQSLLSDGERDGLDPPSDLPPNKKRKKTSVSTAK